MVAKLFDKIISTKEKQSQNALSLMVIKLFGKLIAAKETQS